MIAPIGLAAAFSLIGDLTLFSVLVTQLETVHLTLGQVGIILSVHRLVRIPGNPIAGYLQDRLGRRIPFLLGMILAVGTTAGYGLLSGFVPFVLSRVGWGFAWALINVGGMTMVLDISRENERGYLSGLFNVWVSIGYGLGPLVGSALVDITGFQQAMLICAGLTAIGLIVALWKAQETRPEPTKNPKHLPNLIILLRQSFNLKENSRQLNQTFFLHTLIQFAGDGVVLATITLLLVRRVGETIPAFGYLWSPAMIASLCITGRAVLGMVGSLGAGWVSDLQSSRKAVLAISILTGMGGFLILTWASSLWMIFLGLVINSLSNSAAFTVLTALVRDQTPPEKLGSALGKYAMFGDIGTTLGPFLALTLAQNASLESVYLVGFLALGLGMSLMGAAKTRKAAYPQGA